MIEVHEAAKIVTESVDPNAKIIFGAIKDEKLKKNDVRVTVIATGFHTSSTGGQRGMPLFNFTGRDGKEKEADVPPVNQSALGKMFTTPAPIQTILKEEAKPAEPETKKEIEDETDDWGSMPSFLRRPKIK